MLVRCGRPPAYFCLSTLIRVLARLKPHPHLHLMLSDPNPVQGFVSIWFEVGWQWVSGFPFGLPMKSVRIKKHGFCCSQSDGNTGFVEMGNRTPPPAPRVEGEWSLRWPAEGNPCPCAEARDAASLPISGGNPPDAGRRRSRPLALLSPCGRRCLMSAPPTHTSWPPSCGSSPDFRFCSHSKEHAQY